MAKQDDFNNAKNKLKEDIKQNKLQEMSLEDAFTTISKDARTLLANKEEKMKSIAIRILKEQL